MLELILTALAWILLLGYIAVTVEFAIGNRLVQKLAQLPLPVNLGPDNLPKVSVIIPARNEQRHIEEALTSVLHLDYPNYELVVLNDRSDDQTGTILDRMKAYYPQLQVVHIAELPPGWIGKNHALYRGAQAATGELLLFTDADIVMRPDALTRAVHYLQSKQLDHLAVMPEIISHGFALKIFISAFTIFFSLYARPWLAQNSNCKSHIGIGAFNLIRKQAYTAIGTHQVIALRPDDDMKLGKLVKKHGFRQAAANGLNLIRVEWYASLGELIHGLGKNAFAGLDYSWAYLLFGISMQFLFGVWPVLALFLTHGATQALYWATIICMQLLCLDHARQHHFSRWSGVLFPLSTLLMMYIILRAAILNWWQDGIQWRGTHYSLAQLKANRV